MNSGVLSHGRPFGGCFFTIYDNDNDNEIFYFDRKAM